MSLPRVGIIGAGLIGNKRAANLKGAQLVAVRDRVPERAQQLAKQFNVQVESNWERLVERKDIDIVIVSTTNDSIPTCAAAALRAGKHVLIEKPGGRSLADLQVIAKAAEGAKGQLRVGFNHRFHPAFQEAKKRMDEGALGPLMYIRARYGHGGRLGYEKEWRADPQLAGGGGNSWIKAST